MTAERKRWARNAVLLFGAVSFFLWASAKSSLPPIVLLLVQTVAVGLACAWTIWAWPSRDNDDDDWTGLAGA